MRQGAWLRDEARHYYEMAYLEADADFDRAERKREPAYLAALDFAYELRQTRWDREAAQRQLPLL